MVARETGVGGSRRKVAEATGKSSRTYVAGLEARKRGHVDCKGEEEVLHVKASLHEEEDNWLASNIMKVQSYGKWRKNHKTGAESRQEDNCL
jgi:hypothetical protein